MAPKLGGSHKRLKPLEHDHFYERKFQDPSNCGFQICPGLQIRGLFDTSGLLLVAFSLRAVDLAVGRTACVGAFREHNLALLKLVVHPWPEERKPSMLLSS